jgi:hypothetical protein
MLSGEEDELTWYFDDEHDVMDPISQTFDEMIQSMSTWFFPQEFFFFEIVFPTRVGCLIELLFPSIRCRENFSYRFA